jgi:hypothetical protein
MRKQEASPSPESSVPTVICHRCLRDMRLAFIEPAAINPAGVDTLVYQCEGCDHGYRAPVKAM